MAFDFSISSLFDISSPWFHLLVDDTSIIMRDLLWEDDEFDFLDSFDAPGRGNAKSGQRTPYYLYQPSNILNELSIKEDIWHHQIPFKVNDFLDICRECYCDWVLARNGSNIIRPSKHGIESSLIGTISLLTKYHSLKSTEALIKVDDSLIHIDFERNLQILEKTLSYEIECVNLILCSYVGLYRL